MNLAKRDMDIQQLQKLIKDKHQHLSEKNNTLNKHSKDNLYLKDVLEDYNLYFKNISNERKQQYNALQALVDYIRKITLDPTASEEMIRQCIYDESLILAEMKSLIK
jgi:hypothetical protein